MTAGVAPRGLYIHIPFCKAKCKYCAFVSTVDLSLQKTYVEALLRQMSFCERNTPVDTVYIGGGTPSCLYRGGLKEIFAAVFDRFCVTENAEMTVECNPESADEAFIEECCACGVNRISVGMQTCRDKTLKRIGRIHDVGMYVDAVERLKKRFDNISTDIIIGLPGQDVAEVEQAAELAARYCRHVSIYALTVEEGTPLFFEGYSPDDDLVADMYERAHELLKANGFFRYEVSNFALPGSESRHNKKYWRCDPYIGLGAAAHGYDGESTRFVNTDDISKYISRPQAEPVALTTEDKYNEYIMLRLRTEEGIDLRKFRSRFGYSFTEKNAEAIKKLTAEAPCVIDDGRHFRIAPRHVFVMNGIIEEFMM